jgi:hypothetical protein
MLTILFASMAFAAPSGPPGGDGNGTGGQHNGDGQNGTDHNGPINYANVTVSLIANYNAHYCALDVNFTSSQLDISRHINITGSPPNASINEDTKQFLMMLNRSLAESGGSFTCQLFTNGSGSGNQDGGGNQDSGQHPPIDPNGTAKCNGNPAPAQLVSGFAHIVENMSPDSEPDPNLSSMLSPICPFGLPYADVIVILTVDNDTRSCFLDVNYSSRVENFFRHLNITVSVPSISEGRRQAILILNSSLAAAGGSFKCVLLSNGSADCRSREGNTVPFPARALRDAGIGNGLNDSSLPGPNDTNGLSALCPYGNESNATHDDGIYHPVQPNESALTNYANVTLHFTVDNNARSCFLDLSYSSSQLNTTKRVNVTGAVPGSNTASYGPFKCLLFNDSSAECYGPGSPSPIHIPSFSDQYDIAQQLGSGPAGHAGPANLSAILAGMCPYGANGSSSLGNTTSGGGAGTNASQQGNITITHGNMTGQGGVISNGTGQANATSNSSAATATSTLSDLAAGLALFITSNSTATIIFVALVALLAYVLLKRGMRSSSASK